MNAKSRGVGIKFQPRMLEELDAFAAERRMSRAEVVRLAVDIGLPLMKMGLAINARRTMAILEHTQLALSFMMEQNHPEEAAELLKLAFQNVDAHHS